MKRALVTLIVCSAWFAFACGDDTVDSGLSGDALHDVSGGDSANAPDEVDQTGPGEDVDYGFDLGGPGDFGSPDTSAPPDTTTPPPDTTPDVPPTSTNGCGNTSASGGTWTVQHDGRTREFQVHLPRNYNPNTPTPIVLDYHGRSMSGSQEALLSGMRGAADDHGFIAIHPEGTGGFEQTWNGGLCCGSAQSGNVDDVGFTAAMLDALEAELCVDTGRVYAIGISNGGFMAHRLGCELSDRITAIAGVAGPLNMFSCNPERPVPMIHFHGTSDNVVPYNGFVGQVSAPGTFDTWGDINGCSGSEVYFQKDDVTCERKLNCDQNAEVRLCTIAGGGHTWPGSSNGGFLDFLGHTTQTISATDAFWEFVSSYSM